MKVRRPVEAPFTLLLVALICFGTYPLFLRAPEGSLSLLQEAKSVPCACNCSDSQASSSHLASQFVEVGRSSETLDGVYPNSIVEGHSKEALDSSQEERLLGSAEAKEGGTKPHGNSHKSKSKKSAHPKSPVEDAEEEDNGDLDPEEINALKDEIAKDGGGPKCQCVDGKPDACSDSLNDKAVASVCSIARDIRDIWHLHKWRLSERLNKTLTDKDGVSLAEQLNITLNDGEDVSKIDNPFSAREPGSKLLPKKKPPTLTKQKDQIAHKLLKDRDFRTKIIKKMRDPYGRRFQLPEPFAQFNDILADMQEYQDRDEEDAYLAVLSTAVMAGVREAYHPQDDLLQPDKIFYAVDNHERIRSKSDHFRPDSIALLPEQSPLLQYDTCAVVGNAGSLRDDELGAMIDTHDLIIRTNQAPSFKYERFVGSTTHMRILNKKWTDEIGRRHIDLLSHDADTEIVISSRANVKEFTLLGNALKRLRPRAHVLFLTTRVVTAALRFLRLFRKGVQSALPRHIRGGNTASSGFLAVYMATQFCGSVHAYGFSLEECRSSGCSRDYHYFKGVADSPWLRAHPSHSFELEGLVLKAMHVLGMMCLYPAPFGAGECGSLLGGTIGGSGEWRDGPPKLMEVMARMGIQNATQLPGEIERYKAMHAAEKAAKEAEQAPGSAADKPGDSL